MLPNPGGAGEEGQSRTGPTGFAAYHLTPLRSAVSEPLGASRGVNLRWPPGTPDIPVRAAQSARR